MTEGREHPAASAPPEEKEKKRGYRHGKLVVTLLAIACVLAPIAGVSIWIKNQVTNTDRYVRVVLLVAIELFDRTPAAPGELGTTTSAA